MWLPSLNSFDCNIVAHQRVMRHLSELQLAHVVQSHCMSSRKICKASEAMSRCMISFLNLIIWNLMYCSLQKHGGQTRECMETSRGHKLFLSGGDGHCGVGICVSKNCSANMSDIVFNAYSPRICSLTFRLFGKSFFMCSCYFPTTWDTDDLVNEMYSLLDTRLETGNIGNKIALSGGDFNASIGNRQACDDVVHIRQCGMGQRNERGSTLVHWVLEHGLQIFNRIHDVSFGLDSWTCKRTADNVLVQLDYIIGMPAFVMVSTWNDYELPIGLDHRCVHCILTLLDTTQGVQHRRLGLKHWMPNLDCHGEPRVFQDKLRAFFNRLPFTCSSFEAGLLKAGKQGGRCTKRCVAFKSSHGLIEKRQARKSTTDPGVRKQLSFEIQRMHRQELRAWKSEQISEHVQNPRMWKGLRSLERHPVRTIMTPPHPDDFADMLEALFAGNTISLERPVAALEAPWQRSELTKAIQRMKTQKAADECGLVAELLKHVPEDVLTKLLALMNDLLFSGELPSTWQRTVFQMLPKTAKAMVTSDYRPIASVRVLYKLFAYLVLSRIEHTLDSAQPEEQHGFRKNRRIEEHLITAKYVFDKTLLTGTPIWLISLDLSKAFDRVDWQAFWTALATHGVSQHLIWILQLLYDKQRGRVFTYTAENREFDIHRGVRQGCVLSPRLFCSVLEWALSRWRMRVRTEGIDLEDGGEPLLDLRFADDILVFATSSQQAAYLLDELVVALADEGLILNADKTKLLTTQAQPPKTITTPRGVSVAVVDRDGCHKWLGCILSGNNEGSHRPDLEYNLQAASRAFFANRNILCNKAVSLRKRLHFFDKILLPLHVSPLATERFTRPIWTLWMLIFAGCFDLSLAPPAKQTGWTHGTKFYMTAMLG